MFSEPPATLAPNPFGSLNYEPAFENLGDDYCDRVVAAAFPRHILRFRNDELLPRLGLNPQTISDTDFIAAFGHFKARQPLLAMRYHGYQFGEYNPSLGDGRGFLYGQVRGIDGELYDLGTKGSGTTPYSRGGDGKLTLKGGVREVLAAEALHYLGVRTSRCLSLIETGESLWRGDEPSPTRASVMVRFSRSHIRFGTFERLHHLGRADLIRKLLDHVIEYYYPHLWGKPDQNARFYAELVQRVAELAAQWMSVGFCHAVLNTDNMSITGESFDYGPYGFIDRYDPTFTAAYFDYFKRYSYGNQPEICRLNLEMLQVPLMEVINSADLKIGLAQFDQQYRVAYRQRMLHKLGFDQVATELAEDLLQHTIQLLQETQMGYHDFFLALRQQFDRSWREDETQIFEDAIEAGMEPIPGFDRWRQTYHQALIALPSEELSQLEQRLSQHNPDLVLSRPEIAAVWEPITLEDNWQPFDALVNRLRRAVHQ